LPISFADAGVLGVVPDSKFADVMRLLRQEEKLAAQGFTFQNMNGLLNLLGFWKTTGGNLIPEHLLQIRPPCFIGMPTNELLEPRIEAERRRSQQAIRRPDGSVKVSERMEWNEEGLQRTYFSKDDVRDLHLSAAILTEGRTWWLDTQTPKGEVSDWRYQVWHAVLEWLEAVGPSAIERFPSVFSKTPRCVTLEVPGSVHFENLDPHSVPVPDVDLSIRVTRTSDGGVVEILPTWLQHLRSAENNAELSLIAAILACLARPDEGAPTRTQLRSIALQSVGSRDWRWLHGHHATRAEDRMMATGLTGAFAGIPFSAHALAKCGSIWSFRDREEGSEVMGKAACQSFVVQYCDAMLASLIADISQFDRERLCSMSAERYQDARIEHSRWRNTIRALRAIRGDAAYVGAFERQNEINGAQRAAKVLAELAACEARPRGGKMPSSAEVDDMFAKAVLIFGNSQLYSAILTDLIEPRLQVSPAGDLLSKRDIFSNILLPGAEWMNRHQLNEAADDYLSQRVPGEKSKGALDTNLRTAIEADFRTSGEGYVDFQQAVVEFVQSRQSAIVAVQRSELFSWLHQHPTYGPYASLPHLERLTLPARSSWSDLPRGLRSSDFDFGRFDRPWSLINRPLLALDASDDPVVLVCPMWIVDSTYYCVSGLIFGVLNDRFWVSDEARRYAGTQGKAAGDDFENSLATKLRERGLRVIPRCKPSSVLNRKVPPELGDIDALAVSSDGKRVWVIEAKNLRLCRTETEAASRMQEYRGEMFVDRKGKQQPDKMLRHLRRVAYLREHRALLPVRLNLPAAPEIHGLLVVEAPQPMNFHTVDSNPDGRSVFLDALGDIEF